MVTLGILGLALTGLHTPLWWIITAHIVLEIGLGLLFTPLFTWGLGDLPQNLYPDGSAVVNTLQQVFGAVGTAAFVAIAAAATATMTSSTTPTIAETIDGYRIALWVGVGIGVVTIALSTQVRRTRKRIELK